MLFRSLAVLVRGLVNMARGGSGNLSNKLMQARVALQFLAVALIGVLVLVGAALSVVGGIFAAHRTAQAAADLAALAGAAALSPAGSGPGDPCTAAASTAAANGADLTGCSVSGRDVHVTVTATGPTWRGIHTGDLVAEARAGPVASMGGS